MLKAENLLTTQTKGAPILYISTFAGFNNTERLPDWTLPDSLQVDTFEEVINNSVLTVIIYNVTEPYYGTYVVRAQRDGGNAITQKSLDLQSSERTLDLSSFCRVLINTPGEHSITVLIDNWMDFIFTAYVRYTLI